MPRPNGGLITETNEQYYAGSQIFQSVAGGETTKFQTDFNTALEFGSYLPSNADYNLNNFKLYKSPSGLPGSYEEYVTPYTVVNSEVILPTQLPVGSYLVVQLKNLTGGKYGNENSALGDTVEKNYGGYAYTALNDVIDGFMTIYVGEQKLIPDVKRTDVIFHAKRGLQEFSFDTLKATRSQELTIPPSLSLAFPQDYVNYVSMSYIDAMGVKHPIYPTNALHDSPYQVPLQDDIGQPATDDTGDMLEGSSLTNERWANANDNLISGNISLREYNEFSNYLTGNIFAGQRYGGDPQYMQGNGWFNMNERDGAIMFSSNLNGKLILLEYISDGLAYDLDMRIPKMAEDALYAHILHAIIASRINQPEYIVQRLKRERFAKLRNAKIRLSNIKLSEIVQVMQGKSKWIKS
jgi:hypothetical protein|tara:strand:+ start:3960 stop:5183 length:1224 start_codon:yes stop_codon:yes gene_type:complete